jgi:hypothetical protein
MTKCSEIVGRAVAKETSAQDASGIGITERIKFGAMRVAYGAYVDGVVLMRELRPGRDTAPRNFEKDIRRSAILIMEECLNPPKESLSSIMRRKV